MHTLLLATSFPPAVGGMERLLYQTVRRLSEPPPEAGATHHQSENDQRRDKAGGRRRQRIKQQKRGDQAQRGQFAGLEALSHPDPHQHAGRHEYAISRSPLEADVFISIPKLKTHKKCGITVNLKGLVGINANKNWLPHYSFGAPEDGGDQFDKGSLKTKFENWIVVPAKTWASSDSPL